MNNNTFQNKNTPKKRQNHGMKEDGNSGHRIASKSTIVKPSGGGYVKKDKDFQVVHQKVSVIIPCYNEKNYIGEALDSLINQELDGYEIEILVADGMSSDGTTEIVTEYQNRYDFIHVLENRDRVVPSALKLLLKNVSGDFIVRADAHAKYPKEYISTLIRYHNKENVANVGGTLNTISADDNIISGIIANTLNSKFGVGLSFRTHNTSIPIEVETVPFGSWHSDHFQKYGPFDDKFTRAQDLEHNVRVKKNGGKIICLPWLKIDYYARSNFKKLSKMAFQYGYWKIPVQLKHGMQFSLRQYIPPSLVIITILSFLASLQWPVMLVIPAIYFFLNSIISIRKSLRAKHLMLFPLYMLAFSIMHYCYGFGYLRAYYDAFVKKKFEFSDITR